MARTQQEVAEGSRRLVEADAKARQELTAIQHELRSDQADIGHQRDQLETERREIATQRNRDPIVAATITNIGVVLACLLPLLACVYVLWSIGRNRDSDAAVTDLLVQELVSEGYFRASCGADLDGVHRRGRTLGGRSHFPVALAQPVGRTVCVGRDGWGRLIAIIVVGIIIALLVIACSQDHIVVAERQDRRYRRWKEKQDREHDASPPEDPE